MNCDDIKDALVDYLGGTLPAAANRDVQAHLAVCSACGLEVASLEQTWQDMGLLADEVPSEGLRTRFYARLHEAERAAASPAWAARLASGVTGALAGLWPRRPIYQFAAALLTLILGVLIGLRWRGEPTPTTQSAQQTPPVAVAPGPKATVAAATAPPAAATSPGAAETLAAAVPASEDVHALREEVRSLSHLVALSLLRNDSASDRLEGVSYSRQSGATDPRVLAALLEAASRDANDNVRLAAIDALKPLLGRREVRDRLIEGFDTQRSPLVQIALVDAVATSTGGAAEGLLRSLLARPKLNPAVRQRLEASLAARS